MYDDDAFRAEMSAFTASLRRGALLGLALCAVGVGIWRLIAWIAG